MVDTVFTKPKAPLKTAFTNVKKAPAGGHMDTSNVPKDIKDKVARWSATAHRAKIKPTSTFKEFVEHDWLNETPEDGAFDDYSGLVNKLIPNKRQQELVRKKVSKYMHLVADGKMLALKNKQPWAVDYAKTLPKKIDDINKKYYGKDFDTKSQPPMNIGSNVKEDVGAIGGGGGAPHATATPNMVGSAVDPLAIKKLVMNKVILRRKKDRDIIATGKKK